MIQEETTTLEQRPNKLVVLWRHALVQAFFSDTINASVGCVPADNHPLCHLRAGCRAV